MGTISDQGYQISTASELNTEITNEAIALVPGFNALPSELRTNLVQEAVLVALKCENAVANILNGISPQFANNFLFQQFGQSFGLTQKSAINSQVTLVFSGAVGTYIPLGTIVTNADDSIEVATITDGIINSTETFSVLAQSTGSDPVTILANTMNVLKISISGVTVDNPNAGTTGQEAETDTEYRTRVQNTLAAPRIGQLNRAYELLSQIDGVSANLISFRLTTVSIVTA